MELTALLEKLKMDHLEAQLEAVCEQAVQRELDFKSFLADALETEWQGRFRRGIETRLRLARFPWVKTLEQFDFDFQPSLDRRQVGELSGTGFVERAHNVVILGPPGVGKTHLAVALGVKAVEAGYSVLFLTLETLMTRLVRARHENRLPALGRRHTWTAPSSSSPIPSCWSSTRSATCRSPAKKPACLHWAAGTRVLPVGRAPLRAGQPDRDQPVLDGQSRATRASWIGGRSSTTRCWRLPSWTACCTTPPR